MRLAKKLSGAVRQEKIFTTLEAPSFPATAPTAFTAPARSDITHLVSKSLATSGKKILFYFSLDKFD
ncbi:MAG: hypothetical protein ACRDBM_02870, partial [Sporomusa sp.]